tara:strand:- start:9 stop:908 length:900 start_codon:yes stop_codon:yes gene_type:complete
VPINRKKFLDPKLFAQVKSLYLAARYVAEGAIGGYHKSPYVGYNAEFSHHREYQPGDELRHIDWKRYGKSGKYYVKQYEESSSLNGFLMLDQSASMGAVSPSNLSKERYSQILCCALAYLLLNQRDGVGFLSFAEKMRNFLPISSRMTQFGQLVSFLEDSKSSGRTSLLDSIKSMLPNLKSKCLIIIISDFLDLEDELIEAIRILRFHKHEIVAFHVLSPEELTFPFEDYSTFVDLETGSTLSLDARSVKQNYQNSLEIYLKEIRSVMHQYAVDYQLFNTSIPIEKALVHFLYKRSRHL